MEHLSVKLTKIEHRFGAKKFFQSTHYPPMREIVSGSSEQTVKGNRLF